MNDYIEVERKISSRFPLLREPTAEEIQMIKNDEMFEIEGLIDWDNEDKNSIEEDFSYGKIEVVVNDKTKYIRASRC